MRLLSPFPNAEKLQTTSPPGPDITGSPGQCILAAWARAGRAAPWALIPTRVPQHLPHTPHPLSPAAPAPAPQPLRLLHSRRHPVLHRAAGGGSQGPVQGPEHPGADHQVSPPAGTGSPPGVGHHGDVFPCTRLCALSLPSSAASTRPTTSRSSATRGPSRKAQRIQTTNLQ